MQINVVNMGVAKLLDVAEGTSLGAALDAAQVPEDATVRFRGNTVPRGESYDVSLSEGDTIVATPPTADHGA